MATVDPKLNPHDKDLVITVLGDELKRTKAATRFSDNKTGLDYYQKHLTKLLNKLQPSAYWR